MNFCFHLMLGKASPKMLEAVSYTHLARELLEYAGTGKRKGKIHITNLADEQISLPKDVYKRQVSNDSLSVLLEQEQLKTQRLLEELRTVKSTNATEIRRLHQGTILAGSTKVKAG